jgi:hypothetical protein
MDRTIASNTRVVGMDGIILLVLLGILLVLRGSSKTFTTTNIARAKKHVLPRSSWDV